MPKAFKAISPGSSAANTRGNDHPETFIPIGMTASYAVIPLGIDLHFYRYPVVFAALKPPANG